MEGFGKLYVVATPIGNLNDISARAVDTLGLVNKIYAEDTRVAKKLLDSLDIQNKVVDSYHSHTSTAKFDIILKELISGMDLAIITDAGTPGISDPGNELIEYLLSKEPNLIFIPIPGPSSVVSALSVSGFRSNSFLFIGFLPKKKLNSVFERISVSKETVVYFDSPHRVIKNLQNMSGYLDSNRKVFIAREMTKMHETHYRGDINEVISKLLAEKYLKGEFVCIIQGVK